MVRFHASFRSTGTFRATFGSSDTIFGASFGEVIQIADVPAYEGPYEVTPSQAVQILPSSRKFMTEDVVVNPIPSNYGLITWNGSVLTVS